MLGNVVKIIGYAIVDLFVAKRFLWKSPAMTGGFMWTASMII